LGEDIWVLQARTAGDRIEVGRHGPNPSMTELPPRKTRRWVARRKSRGRSSGVQRHHLTGGRRVAAIKCRRRSFSRGIARSRALASSGCASAAFSNSVAVFPPDRPTRPLPRHSTRVSPQRSKIKTAKRPNIERRRSPILPIVTLAPARSTRRNRRPGAKGGAEVKERSNDKG
jgi:hypothetical protein